MAHVLEIQGYNRRGGSERHTAILARRLARRGWTVTVAAPPGGLITATALETASYVPVSLSGRYDLGSVARLAHFCRRRRVDVVHTHCRNADLLGGLACGLAGVPYLVTTLHGMLPEPEAAPHRGFVDRVHHAFLARRPDLLLGISRAVSRRAVETLGVDPGRVHTVLNGTEAPTPDQFDLARRLADSWRDHPREILVVQAGSLEPSKDPGTLLAAVHQGINEGLPLRLVLVGTGSLQETLRQEARERGIADRVIFTGEVADAGPYLGAADIACLASRREGFGRVLTEAMSYGRPVVASRTGGMVEIVEHERSGLLVEPGSVPAWAHALRRLGADSPLREAMGRRAATRFALHFGAGRFVDETEHALQQLLGRRSRVHEPRALEAA